MLKFYFDKRIIAGLAVALSILFWLTYLSHNNKARIISSSDSVAHTLAVLYRSESVLTIATNLELGQRGYTITGKEIFLTTYNSAKNDMDRQLDTLNTLTSDNETQQARISELGLAIKRLLAFSDQAVAARTRSFEEAQAMNASLEGRIMLDSIRKMVAEIQLHENELLSIRSHRNQDDITGFNRTFIYLLVAITLILISIFYAINANLKARIDSEHQLNLALIEIEDLYNNAPCGYHSIDSNGIIVNVNNTLCNWLGYSRREMVGKIAFTDLITDDTKEVFARSFPKFKETGVVFDLEFNFIRKNGTMFPVLLSAVAIKDENGRYIKSRTITIDNTERKKSEIEIRNLNNELEAFTYSVSHDLRAPLRSVDGYARILQEDYARKLDEEGERVINVIINNARRMGKLIDDLLEFARLGRKELVKNRIDMTTLVNSVKRELLDDEKSRQVEIIVNNLDNAPVDIDMIKQVWMNLLSNAVKYTGKKEKARIEISSEKSEEFVKYIVKDNGVGFDMQYVSKLFGVFQRLHRIQDFSGTGVGLAIVKRIIDKHHGCVWAEAKLNEGANFYFTIPIDHVKQ
jgi:PAS domain S-box-containing protein